MSSKKANHRSDPWDWVQPGEEAESVDVEEVWNPCTILSRNRSKVKVRYDGWDASFDEEVLLSGARISRPGVHTIRRRCWVKTQKGVTLPAIAFLRSGATQKGVEYLESETKLLLRVFHEKKVEYMFLEPKRCMSWFTYSTELSPLAAVTKCCSEAADTLPMHFLRGTLPKDECLQLRHSVTQTEERVASEEQFTAYAADNNDKAPSKQELQDHSESRASTSKRARTASASLTKSQPAEEGSNGHKIELSPSERLRLLAASIESSFTEPPPPFENVERSIGKAGTHNDDPSIGESTSNPWGIGGAIAEDEFTMRGLASSLFENL